METKNIIALRMERQFFTKKADYNEYDVLYRDMQPGQNVYWNGFGDPPSISFRADFDDIEYNRQRQENRTLIKCRLQGGNLGWILYDDLELFASLYIKPLANYSFGQQLLINLIKNEGPMTIQQMKESTGMLVKEITPILHRLQEAFLVYEDQYNGEWDRGWYDFFEMFPDVNLNKYSLLDALQIIIQRFAYRNVLINSKNIKSFYKLPDKQINAAITELINEGILTSLGDNYILTSDYTLLENKQFAINKSVFALHRNDFLVKSNEYWLKEKFTHSYPDTLYYLLINGEFYGAVVGKFRYTPEVEDIVINLPSDEAIKLKEEMLQAVRLLCGSKSIIKRYQGKDN